MGCRHISMSTTSSRNRTESRSEEICIYGLFTVSSVKAAVKVAVKAALTDNAKARTGS